MGVIVLFAWVIAGIVVSGAGYMLYEPPGPTGITHTADHESRQRSKAYYDIIEQRNLFCVSDKPSQAREPVKEDVIRPLAQMGLELKGTIAGPVDIARAIIEENRKQDIYRVSDTIKGARILAIYRNKIIMDVRGKEEMLIIEEAKSRAKSLPARRTSTRSSTRASIPDISGGLSGIMQNLDEYIGKARIVPYFKGGKPYGFRVSNVDKDSLIYELGVRSGDVVRSVNGTAIHTPEDAFKAYQELQDASGVEVELERRGSSTTLNIPLQ